MLGQSAISSLGRTAGNAVKLGFGALIPRYLFYTTGLRTTAKDILGTVPPDKKIRIEVSCDDVSWVAAWRGRIAGRLSLQIKDDESEEVLATLNERIHQATAQALVLNKFRFVTLLPSGNLRSILRKAIHKTALTAAEAQDDPELCWFDATEDPAELKKVKQIQSALVARSFYQSAGWAAAAALTIFNLENSAWFILTRLPSLWEEFSFALDNLYYLMGIAAIESYGRLISAWRAKDWIKSSEAEIRSHWLDREVIVLSVHESAGEKPPGGTISKPN